MQELFLTSFVRDGADFERASAVLHGLANMSGWESLHRVVYFAGPLPPKGFNRSIPASAKTQQQQMALWSGLHQVLQKISHVLQLRYEVFRDRDFCPDGQMPTMPIEGPDAELNKTGGTLRWTDFPKPTENQPVISRKKIEIVDQKNLITIVKDNNHRFKSEAIEESVSYFIDSVEISLVRYYHMPPAGAGESPAQPLGGPVLPAWSSLRLLDPSGTWMLFVRTTVFEDNAPDKLKKAQDDLYAMRDKLAGVFGFKMVDRRAHDTRILLPTNNLPAPMPAAQRLRG
ncbi:hypothetical protein RB594_003346 [Gaeumannomyces avenae]